MRSALSRRLAPVPDGHQEDDVRTQQPVDQWNAVVLARLNGPVRGAGGAGSRRCGEPAVRALAAAGPSTTSPSLAPR
ncbi:hypothetical protein [Kitasatospora purpeofusca]|uniref:hypothetical protein n=1 Tax=Kitasatospora purpeofusca TaxID=67352 RepID=UPI0004C28DB2